MGVKAKVASIKPMSKELHGVLLELVSKEKRTNMYKGVVTPETCQSRISLVEGARDDSLYYLSTCLRRGGLVEEDASQVVKILAQNCTPPFQDWRAKVRSAYNGGPPARSLTGEIEALISVTEGVVSVTDIDRELEIVTKCDKASRRKVLSRCVAKGVLQPARKSGVFRIVKTHKGA